MHHLFWQSTFLPEYTMHLVHTLISYGLNTLTGEAKHLSHQSSSLWEVVSSAVGLLSNILWMTLRQER